jgi:nucleotide-binding universal stress UspA family protein
MYKHLLVAVDGSHTSENALDHAIGLALGENAELTLVNVANPTEYMALAPEFLQHESYEAAALSEGNNVLDEAMKKATASLPADRVHRHLLVAIKGVKEMAQMLVDYADEQKVDIIILGTHGRSGLMHLLMGSFAETVMRETNLPLLIIRSESEV